MNISVLGCGWLGLPLAVALIEKGHIVNGSTSSPEKIAKLSAEGIIPYQIKLFEEGIQGDIASFFNDARVLIINIPPGLKKDPTQNFQAKMGRLKDQIDHAAIKKIIFISSTSVFEDREDMPVYTEEEQPNGTLPTSEQLKGVENLMLSEDQRTSVLRFGGLYGPGRHPVKYLAGSKDIKDPEAPVNLIHRDDCIGIIRAIIESEASGIFHGVNPNHPSRKDYYLAMAGKKNLPIPEFHHASPSKGKFINSNRVEKELGYVFEKNLYE